MTNQVFDKEYANQYDLLYSDKDYEAECDLLEQVFQRYTDQNINVILDLGCGTGSHVIPLARRGYRVTGIDRSADMLSHALHKAKTNLSPTQNTPIFQQGDVRSLNLEQTFDAVLMMFAVLCYQITNKDVLDTLKSIRRHLRPGGLFVFDVWYGPAVLAIRPSDRVKVILTPDGQVIRAVSCELDVRHHLCEVRYQLWQISEDRVISTSNECHRMRYFFPMEIDQWLAQVDIKLEALKAFPGFEKPADESTWNVLAIGRSI